MMTVMTNIFLSFLGTSASVSLIVAALMLLTSVLNRRYAAKWKYWIWIFLALRLLVPFSGTNGLSVTALLSRVKTQTASEAEDNHTQVLPDAAAPRRMIVELPTQMTAPIAAQSEKGGGSITLLAVMTLVWMLGGLAVISVHLISYLHYRSQVNKEGTIIKDRRILRRMYELKRELRIKRTIRAVEYPEAASPMVIGFVNPVLILPDARYSGEELFFILKHELVHFKRGDVYVKLLFVVANAAHWFNPLIWMMQKEAAVDMELSCDESVVQGTNYTVRKAYTETLLSMLHRRCTRRTVLSTQFYGGKNIMKKRFKNILIKKRKKSGAAILTGIVILTISLGTLVGCRVAEETAQDVTDRAGVEDVGEVSDRAGREDAGNASDRTGGEAGDVSDRSGGQTAGGSSVRTGSENMSSDDNSQVSNNAPEATRTLTFIKEGEPEEVQAALAIGNGYSLYLPDGSWRLSDSDSDTWTAVVNEQVSLWVTHFEGAAIQAVEEELTGDGYEAADDDLVKREEEMIYKTRLYTSGNDVWGVNYCYPAEAEEGWGRSLPVIADTFAVSAADGGSGLGAAERQGIRNIVDEFAAAYFNGNVGTMQKFLASTYEGKISAYEGTGTISDLTVKGLSDADEHRTGDGSYVVSLEYRDSNSADTFRYLTFTFVRQEDDWKIQFYGLEG